MAERVARRYISRMPVRDNTALSRFEFDAGGVTAFVNYRIDGGTITLLHTETPQQARGQGLASQLTAGCCKSPARAASR
jgi:predicted GNAT family acetyltransferase